MTVDKAVIAARNREQHPKHRERRLADAKAYYEANRERSVPRKAARRAAGLEKEKRQEELPAPPRRSALPTLGRSSIERGSTATASRSPSTTRSRSGRETDAGSALPRLPAESTMTIVTGEVRELLLP